MLLCCDECDEHNEGWCVKLKQEHDGVKANANKQPIALHMKLNNSDLDDDETEKDICVV